jgi:hypothetical protein
MLSLVALVALVPETASADAASDAVLWRYQGQLKTALKPRIPKASFQFGDRTPRLTVYALQRSAGEGCELLTSGLGVLLAPDDPELSGVELLAVAPASGRGIAEVLFALARALLEERERGVSILGAYRTVDLGAPVSGLQGFDLRPGGELTLPNGKRVQLLKVVPVSEESSRDEPRDSQWVDPDAIAPDGEAKALDRWAPALEHPN